MSQVAHISPTPQDPLTMAAKRLGEAKTAATTRGMGMLDLFEQIQKEVDTLKQHGLSITTVQFENKSIQAAWRTYNASDWTEIDMPMMDNENSLVEKVLGQ